MCINPGRGHSLSIFQTEAELVQGGAVDQTVALSLNTSPICLTQSQGHYEDSERRQSSSVQTLMQRYCIKYRNSRAVIQVSSGK